MGRFEDIAKDMKFINPNEKDHLLDAFRYYVLVDFRKEPAFKKYSPDKIIVNGNATVYFWRDGDKTVLHKHNEDKTDYQKAFLIAFFQKHTGMCKRDANAFLKQFLYVEKDKEIIMYRKDSKVASTKFVFQNKEKDKEKIEVIE